MMKSFSPVFEDSYEPLKAGSIDGTDEYPHDQAISRAMQSNYKVNRFVKGDPECTVFVARLNPHTTEETMRRSFKQYGQIVNVRLIRDIVTGFSKCYCFIEFEDTYEARTAARKGHKMIVDEHEILVEHEKERILKGWVPRRLGGGLGGKRESGQLRFGGKDRQFRRPILYLDTDKGNVTTSVDEDYSGSSHGKNRRSRSRGSQGIYKGREKHSSRDR